jgi:hypothetical protein
VRSAQLSNGAHLEQNILLFACSPSVVSHNCTPSVAFAFACQQPPPISETMERTTNINECVRGDEQQRTSSSSPCFTCTSGRLTNGSKCGPSPSSFPASSPASPPSAVSSSSGFAFLAGAAAAAAAVVAAGAPKENIGVVVVDRPVKAPVDGLPNVNAVAGLTNGVVVDAATVAVVAAGVVAAVVVLVVVEGAAVLAAVAGDAAVVVVAAGDVSLIYSIFRGKNSL